MGDVALGRAKGVYETYDPDDEGNSWQAMYCMQRAKVPYCERRVEKKSDDEQASIDDFLE